MGDDRKALWKRIDAEREAFNDSEWSIISKAAREALSSLIDRDGQLPPDDDDAEVSDQGAAPLDEVGSDVS